MNLKKLESIEKINLSNSDWWQPKIEMDQLKKSLPIVSIEQLFNVVNNFLDLPHNKIHELRKKNDYCGTCMEHGLHDNWKMKQSQFFYKNLLGNNFISKIQRKIFKKIL